MKMLIKKIVKRAIFAYLERRGTTKFRRHEIDHRLISETVGLLQSLAGTIDAIPISEPIDEVWKSFQKEFINQISEASLPSFLRLPIIQETMFANFAPYLVKEHLYVRSKIKKNSKLADLTIEDGVGTPLPFLLDTASSGNLIHSLYHLLRFEEFANVSFAELGRVVEFGGGYGSLCRVLYRAGFHGSYWIHDLPMFSLLQVFFLRTVGFDVVHESHISDVSRPKGITCFNKVAKGRYPGKGQAGKTLYIATWSLSEVGLEYRTEQEEIMNVSSYFLIAFFERLKGFDNLGYFKAIAEQRKDIEWQIVEIPHMRKSYYMFGRPVAS